MKALFKFTALLILLGLAAYAGLFCFARYLDLPGPNPETKIVFIAPGTGVRAMAQQLKDENIIRQPYAFLAAVQLWNIKGKLQAGEYEMPMGVTLRGVIGKIANGDVYARAVTIPEGLWSSEIAAIINNVDSMTGNVAAPPEGSVLPETYAYIRNMDRNKLLADAQDAMAKTLDTLWQGREANLPFDSKEQALVLASIVEKETGIASERPRIAGVYINRLRKGMMLQSDPTVIYAVTKGTAKLERVLYQHLETDSPYNTYKYIGLPPGPICNPGRAAIEAVLHPEVNDYLYFVADGTGGHVFATTIADHTANVAKWRAVQRQAR
jgi:UPF0755 protein